MDNASEVGFANREYDQGAVRTGREKVEVRFDQEEIESDEAYVEPQEAGQATDASLEKEESGDTYDKKIIRDAELQMEAKDSISLYKELVKYGNELGGYEFSYELSNYETYSVIKAVYKIPPDKLDQWLEFAGDTGRIINSHMSSNDITDSYYDVKTRLESKRKSLEQYYSLLQKTTTIDEISRVQGIIDQITEEIEASEGRLKMWNSLIDMATVTMLIRAEQDPVKIKKEITWNTLTLSDMGYLIHRGVVSVLNALISMLQWLLIALVVTSPIWIIVGIVLWVWLKKIKVRKKNNKELNLSNRSSNQGKEQPNQDKEQPN
jgi:hypothetical protein